uniref:Uncharacterized protein n=1 Tax=Anguilla anguilla TaxID=7936 RepID=A0A0E9V592_ANGAN
MKETTMKIIPINHMVAGGGQQTGIKQFGGLGRHKGRGANISLHK